MIIMFSLIAAYYVFSDLTQIYREKKWNVFWIYTIILSLDFIITILAAVGISLPGTLLPPIKK